MPKKSCPAAIRFWTKVKPSSGCLEWVGGKYKSGYGAFGATPGQSVLAHRISYELENGPIPDGMYVCHSCDNRGCVNPEHLFLGTAKDNTRDMCDKWRTQSKLNAEDVAAIRQDTRPYRIIAEQYNLKSHKSVYNIKRGKTF